MRSTNTSWLYSSGFFWQFYWTRVYTFLTSYKYFCSTFTAYVFPASQFTRLISTCWCTSCTADVTRQKQTERDLNWGEKMCSNKSSEVDDGMSSQLCTVWSVLQRDHFYSDLSSFQSLYFPTFTWVKKLNLQLLPEAKATRICNLPVLLHPFAIEWIAFTWNF